MKSMEGLIEIFWILFFPWLLMYIALSYLPGTVRRLFRTEGIRALSWANVKHAWFSAFWARHGSNIRKRNGPLITALLEGRVTKARVVDSPVAPPVSGVVLDIGPGVGFWVDLYTNLQEPKAKDGVTFRDGSNRKLKVYGIEPSTSSHADLRSHIQRVGLEGTYEIVPRGIQSITTCEVNGIDGSTTTIEKGSVDCIVSLLCLCSIPEPEKNIAELYKYLKKGGRWYIYEHVRVKGSWPMGLYQAFINLFWPQLIGGCQLCRDTERSLREAGAWSNIDVAQPPEEMWAHVIPHRIGTFTK
ncbi:Nn.00g086960.m01.CDS01 [Neocucurbitaria sp. VM-36]